MELTDEEKWSLDLQQFISHWEKEVDGLQEKQLDSDECGEIVEQFHKTKDMLLCQRPVNLTDDNVLSKLEPLTNKLDNSLAMALCSISVKKEF